MITEFSVECKQNASPLKIFSVYDSKRICFKKLSKQVEYLMVINMKIEAICKLYTERRHIIKNEHKQETGHLQMKFDFKK